MATRPRISGTTDQSRQRGGVRPIYENFKPMSEWIQDQDADILLIYLPGFMKENIKVSAEGTKIIRVRGERSVSGNKWHQLLEDYQVPDYCNVRGTRARFEGGILTINVPKKTIAPSGPKDDHVPKRTEEHTPKQDHPKAPLTGPQKAAPNDKVDAKSSQETTPGDVGSRAEPTPHDNSKALVKSKPAQETKPRSVANQAEPTPQDNSKALVEAKFAQETTPGDVASQAEPTPQDNSKVLAEAKFAQETTTRGVASQAEPIPQDNSKALAAAKFDQETTPSGVASQVEPTPQNRSKALAEAKSAQETTLGNVASQTKPLPQGNSEALASQKRLSEPKFQEGRDNGGQEMNSTRLMDSEHCFKQDDTMEGSETESITTDNSEMSKNGMQSSDLTNAEKNDGPLLPDRVENITKKIADGVEVAQADKNKYVEPKANETGTSQFRVEKYKQSLRGLMELDEEKQLLLNVGVAMLVIVALGTYAFYRSRK